MKRSALFLLFVLTATLALSAAAETTPREWVMKNFAKGQVPPFAFTYGGKESSTFIRSWEFKMEQPSSTDPAVSHYVATWHDRSSGLAVTCDIRAFSDFPAVEWTIRFKNTLKGNSPILEKVRAVDYRFRNASDGAVTLHHSRGSSAERSDFMGLTDVLGAGKNLYMTPPAGRSSEGDAFPFFNVVMPGNEGIITAIGWSGKWYADVSQADLKGWSLKAGMERMKLYLEPGEQIRTPEICLLFWKGADRMTGHNIFRQFILKHHTRMINGKMGELPLAATLGGGGPQPCNEFACATESYCLAMVDRHKQFGIIPEVMWIDAGWYTGCGQWWSNVGNWTVDKTRFPNGLKPVTDAVHKAGAKFILWFEPERIWVGTQFDQTNPEFLITIPDTADKARIGGFSKENRLFNLGNPAAREWLIWYISNLIRVNGVDYYRQDFNFDPLPYWKYNDKPGRTGISEIRHIEGLYAYWDALLTAFPNLIIDNCASGGRRLDLETVSRSSPLWRTDYSYGEPNGYQCHTYGLNFYLPMHGTGNFVPSTYAFRSSMSTGMVTGWDLGNASYSQSAMQTIQKDFKRLRPFYYGDYYPLTPNSNITTDTIWLAYQQNRPVEGDGIIMAFRRPDCPVEKITVKPRGLQPDGVYQVVFEDSGMKREVTGTELMNGMSLETKEKPGSLLVSYTKKQ